MPRILLEICRSNQELVRAGYDDFEENPTWSRRLMAIEIANWFEMLGLPRRMAHGKRVTNGPYFIEWDSGNPGHAGGYWEIEIEVSQGLYDLIQRAANSED